MNWIKINSQKDVDYLNDIFDNFHDSFLKEVSISLGSYVDRDSVMHENNKPIARFLFQRHWDNPPVIEIEFGEVMQINIKPASKNEFTYIMESKVYYEKDVFFLSTNDYEYYEDGKNDYTWIAAKEVKWRVRDDLLGGENVYFPDN